jgi:hypothetical protein
MKHWEIIADNLKKAGWSWGCVSAIDSKGRTIWIADARRDYRKRFVGRFWFTSRLSRICLIAISLLFTSTLGASAHGDAMGRTAVLYAASGTFGVQGILYTLDPATGAVLTTVGPLHDANGNFYGITGLKYHPATGIFYGATGHGSPTNPNYLVIVDPVTALVTPIGSLGVGALVTDIAIDPTTGTMYGLNEYNQNFYTINTSTGRAVQTGLTGIGLTNEGGLAADRRGALFGVTDFSFYSFNKTTGVATLIGPTGLRNWLKAADFNPSNVLYGLEGGGGSDNVHLRWLVTFNVTTGTGTRVGQITARDLGALAFIPVGR